MSDPELTAAIWAGDTDKLNEIAPCRCCCDEHFFESCAARQWGGCRGQYSVTRSDIDKWAKHYERFHVMSRETFYGER